MPLMKSKSKKAVGKNIEMEMDMDKPRKQSIAIALDVQRRSKPKFAKGGKVPEQKGVHDPRYGRGNGSSEAGVFATSAKIHHDLGHTQSGNQDNLRAKEKHRSNLRDLESMPKPNLYADGGSVMEREDERDLQSYAHTGSFGEQPKKAYDSIHTQHSAHEPEMKSPHTGETEQDMMLRHATERAAYAKGGRVNEDHLAAAFSGDNTVNAIMKRRRMADGGMISSDTTEEGPGERFETNEAAKKENFVSDEDFSYSDSGEEGDSREDEAENEHDEDDISRIMRKMKKA